MRIALRNRKKIIKAINNAFVCDLMQSLRIFTSSYGGYSDTPPTTRMNVAGTEYESIEVQSSTHRDKKHIFIIVGKKYDVFHLAYLKSI